MVGSESPRAAKAALRREARALRALHLRDEPQSFLDALLNVPAWRAARTVALYLPQPGSAEPPVAELVADCWNSGRRVCVPAWVAPSDTGGECAFPEPGRYSLALYSPGTELVAGPMGIPQPADPTWVPADEPDLFVVPGLLFDASGRRLGHGAGHIDRILAGRRSGAVVLGLAYPWQIASAPLPDDPWDVSMDAVVLPVDGSAAARGEGDS